MTRVRKIYLLVALFALFIIIPGCKERAPREPEKAAEELAEAVEEEKLEPSEVEVLMADSAARKRFILIVKEIGPVIRLEGSPEEIPRAVKFMFPKDVVEKKDVGDKADKDALIEIIPEIKGSARWTGCSILTFEPEDPLPFDSAFKIKLLKVKTIAGIIEPPEGEEWAKKFVTPGFDLRRVELMDVDMREGKAYILMTFTGPADLDSVKENCEVRLDQGQPSPSALTFSYVVADHETQSSYIHLKISSRLLGMKRKLKISLKPGITSRDGKHLLEQSITAYQLISTSPILHPCSCHT